MIIAVVDEKKEACEKTKKFLESFFFDMLQEEKDSIQAFSSFKEFEDTFSQGYFGVIVADPGGPQEGGMDLLRRIRIQDKKVTIIIYTDYQEYVLEGYTVSAFRYILKFQDQAEELLTNAVEQIMKEDIGPYLTVNSNGKELPVFYRDILYAECIRRNVYLHLISKKTLKIKNPIREIAKKLCSDRGFMECYRDIIVNVSWVKEIGTQELMLADGEKIPLSRRRKTRFRRQWAQYPADNVSFSFDLPERYER